MENTEYNFLAIIAKTGNVYITDNVKGTNYFTSKISNMLFDGHPATSTFKKNWYEVSNVPKHVQVKTPDSYKLLHYKLKEGYPVSKLTPETVEPFVMDEEDESFNLYRPVYETIVGTFKDVQFDIEVLDQISSFYPEKPKYPITTDIITAISVHPDLHTEVPCFLNSADFYKVVRNWVKEHIDPHYAEITSDFNFCFTVKKKIKLAEPVVTTYNVNASDKRRKPKYVTKTTTHEKLTVFEMAPKAYNSYTVLKPIRGKNYEDLENKVMEYLTGLMEHINKPLEQCPHCNGTGVILTEDFNVNGHTST